MRTHTLQERSHGEFLRVGPGDFRYRDRIKENGDPRLATFWLRLDRERRVRLNRGRLKGTVLPCGKQTDSENDRGKQTDSENDREPDPPHGAPRLGWLAGV